MTRGGPRLAAALLLSLAGGACAGSSSPATAVSPAPAAFSSAEAGALLGALAADSMEGRGTATQVGRVDLAHLARLADAAARAARRLADGEAPTGRPGGRPLPPH